MATDCSLSIALDSTATEHELRRLDDKGKRLRPLMASISAFPTSVGMLQLALGILFHFKP